LLGYLALFHEIGLDYTSAPSPPKAAISDCSTRTKMMKRLNAKIYAEARRLG